MPCLPIPGGDQGNWGQILNDYLAQSHNTDGTIKDNSISESALDAVVRTKLNAVAGPQGATGATGPQGMQGAAGAIGATGSQGVAGTNGANGATGATGPQGTAGAAGTTGATGATGPQGATGTNGTVGATGATGPAGADGTSVTIMGNVASAAALPTGLGVGDAGDGYITDDNGHLHVWSGTDWTDVGVVRGPDGPTGASGPQGPTGATGPQGAAGAMGATGANGTTGATGPAGMTTIADLPAGSMLYTSGLTRPTARTDILVIFTGADPGSAALDGDLWMGA